MKVTTAVKKERKIDNYKIITDDKSMIRDNKVIL